MSKMGGNNSCLKDYGTVCTVCGLSAITVGGFYLIVNLLLRYYLKLESLVFFEPMVPTYVPAITFSICGFLTVACAWKSYRHFLLLKLTAWLALSNAIIASIIAVAVIFINLKISGAIKAENCSIPAEAPNYCECIVYPFSPAFPEEKTIMFDHSNDCTFASGIVNGGLLLVVINSTVAIGLSIFMWRLLDELIE